MVSLEGYEALLDSGSTGLDLDVNILGILSYVFLAIGLYSIAKRRGIKKPWLAWIPVANVWLLGCVSDQYQYVVHGAQKSKRKAMLTLQIIITVLAVAVVVLAVVMVAGVLGKMDWNLMMVEPDVYMDSLSEELLNDSVYLQQLVGSVIGMVLAALVMGGCAIALTVLQYMAFHDIFASCDPKNKTIFLVIGIIASLCGLELLMSIFVFVCRNKDLGMPPRRDQAFEQPTWQPPVQQMDPPAWQPPQPPVEPWEQNDQ